MNYLHKLTGEYPVSEASIRTYYPNTSFPTPFQAPEEYALVFQAPQPTFDALTQSVRETTPMLTAKGHYEQQWEVQELFSTQAEKDAAIAADIEAKRIAAIPAEISPRQIRQAMTAAGLRSSVEMAVAAADQDTKDWWEFATTFERAHPRVVGMAQALNVTELQLDGLWTMAGSL